MSSSENLPRLAPLRIWLPFCAWLILIFGLSAYPKALIPQGRYISWDKIAHAVEFGVFGYLTARAAYFSGLRFLHFNWWWSALIFGAFYAALDEWHQLHVPGRWASPYDVAADAFGVVLGVWFFHKIRRGKKIKT